MNSINEKDNLIYKNGLKRTQNINVKLEKTKINCLISDLAVVGHKTDILSHLKGGPAKNGYHGHRNHAVSVKLVVAVVVLDNGLKCIDICLKLSKIELWRLQASSGMDLVQDKPAHGACHKPCANRRDRRKEKSAGRWGRCAASKPSLNDA